MPKSLLDQLGRVNINDFKKFVSPTRPLSDKLIESMYQDGIISEQLEIFKKLYIRAE